VPYHVTMLDMTEEVRKGVRIAMAARKWNQKKLSEETGVSRQFVSEMMSGKAAVLPPSWQKVLDSLGLELTIQPKPTAEPGAEG
jgi:transcriptional regulator with XRE-family HTH domain